MLETCCDQSETVYTTIFLQNNFCYGTKKSQNSQYLQMQFLYSKHIPLIEEMIAKAQEKVIETNPKDTFNMGFHAIPSMAQVFII